MTVWSSVYWWMRRRDSALHVGPGHHILFLSTLQSVRNPDSPEGQEETRVGWAPSLHSSLLKKYWEKGNGLPLLLKLRYFGHLRRRTDSLEKTWHWERLRAGGEGDDRGWDGWMASLTQWTWVSASSGRWWRTGKSHVLQFIELQRVGHNLVTKQLQKQLHGKSTL